MQPQETEAQEPREHPVDVIERLVALEGWTFERHDHDEISLRVQGVWASYEVAITWLRESESLHFSCAFDLRAPERKQADIGELIRLANSQMWLGHFDLWSHENLVMFRHAHCLAGGAHASEAQARAVIEAALKACETYYQSFQFVLWAGRSPREAMDFALFETAGAA